MAINWNCSRKNEKFTYTKVLYPSFEETGEYKHFSGGSIEYSLYSDLKCSGSLTVDGNEMPDMNSLVRVYYSFEDDYGNASGLIPLATMFITCSEPAWGGAKTTMSLTGYSTLYLLSQRILGAPRTYLEGTNPIEQAKSILEGYHIADVAKIDAANTGRKLNAPHTFDADATLLEVVNWLLNAGGANAAMPDAFGMVAPYSDAQTEPVLTFKDDGNSIMYPDASKSTNFYDLPNVCRAYYSNSDESIWAVAINVDPASDISTVTLGYEKTLYENYSEVAGDTIEERQTNLAAKASYALLDNTAQIDYVTVKNAYCGLGINDNVLIDYQLAGINFQGNISNLSISLESAIPVTTKIRHYQMRDYQIQSRSGWIIKPAE